MPRLARIVFVSVPPHITQRGSRREDVFILGYVSESGFRDCEALYTRCIRIAEHQHCYTVHRGTHPGKSVVVW
jgi:hypothetical protein